MNYFTPKLMFAATLIAQSSLSAGEPVNPSAIRESLKGVPALELPTKASKLVAAASEKQKEAVAVALVRVAIERNPSSAPAVIRAVAKDTPSVGPAMTAAAVKLQGTDVEAIKSATLAPAAAASHQPERDQPENPRGTGQGQGHGDGGGHGRGHAWGHVKHYASP